MTFSIESIETHAELSDPAVPSSPLVQWASITIAVPKGFNFEKDGQKLLNKIQNASELIGRGD